MFGPRFNEQKLKVNLGLVVTRLKLIEKKKTDQALRARPEIADYVRNAKVDRARVRVEHIIREDYMVEAMELVEMYADLLAGRVGLMKQSKALDEGLKTPISTLIWATPRLVQYCQEIKVVHDILGAYYGKKYVEACRNNDVGTVCERVMQKLDVRPPKKILVERYLIEICKSADVDFTPDPRIMASEIEQTANLIDTDFMEFNQQPPPGSGGMGSGGGGGAAPLVPTFGYTPAPPPGSNFSAPTSGGNFSAPTPGGNFNAPTSGGNFNVAPGGGSSASLPPSAPNNLPPYTPTDPNAYNTSSDEKQAPALPDKGPAGSLGNSKVDMSQDPSGISASLPSYSDSLAPPNTSQPPVAAPRSASPGFPVLPSVPTNFPGVDQSPGNQSSTSDDVDFDDLSRRFENLRKKK